MKFNNIYVVHYRPNCEEDYVIYTSFFKKNCELFIKKHSCIYSFGKKNKYYHSYELFVKKYKLEHWYRI